MGRYDGTLPPSQPRGEWEDQAKGWIESGEVAGALETALGTKLSEDTAPQVSSYIKNIASGVESKQQGNLDSNLTKSEVKERNRYLKAREEGFDTKSYIGALFRELCAKDPALLNKWEQCCLLL